MYIGCFMYDTCMLLSCLNCETQFLSNRSKRKFCSRRCSNKHHNSIRKNGREFTCFYCHKSYYKSNWHKNKTRFCSFECLHVYLKISICKKYGFQKKNIRKERRKYIQCRINGRNKLFHRHVMEKHIGRNLRPSEHVHHINNNPLDNRIENLIILTHSDHSKITCKENNNYNRQ